MKKYMFTPILVLLLTAFATVSAQNQQEEYLGLPGDNLNLYAVMKLFQESETLEGFERKLNDPESRINNLDLNGDGYVDYIRVIDNVERNTHYIVLQVSVSQRENQDVAVFNVVRDANGNVDIQLIGDEALYGRNYIIEPIFDETPNPGYMGNNGNNGQRVVVTRTTRVEIAAWPLVHFIFLPTYVMWHSPWYYNYYPNYWHPWSPFYWHYYYGYQSHYYSYYYGHYRHYHEYRNPQYHSYYYNEHRAYSPYVSNRIHEGYYKTTYSHPEQRRQGSALYVKTHDVQNTRSANGNAVNASGRRSVSEGGTTRTSTSTGTTRQSTGTSTTRQSTGTTRQSTGTSTTRQSTGTTRQSTGASTTRQSTTTAPIKQSTNSGTVNSGRRSSTGTQATQNKTSGKTTTGTTTGGRRTSGGTKSQSSGSKDTKSGSGGDRR